MQDTTDTLLIILIAILSVLAIVALSAVTAAAIAVSRLVKKAQLVAEASGETLDMVKLKLASNMGIFKFARYAIGKKIRRS